jgi:hypothetical protein
MTMDRRAILQLGVGATLLGALPRAARAQSPPSPTSEPQGRADYTIRIANGLVELAPDRIISTTTYNGQFPGPLLRFNEGQQTVVDIHNDTDTPEVVHWHGQMIPSDVDGASEEGTPFVPAHGMRRISFVPKPSGFRFYHTHVVAGGDLNRGTYTGQAGPVYIEPKTNPGAYDREIFLVLKEFAPAFSRGGDMAMDVLAGAPVKALQQTGRAADEEARRHHRFDGVLLHVLVEHDEVVEDPHRRARRDGVDLLVHRQAWRRVDGMNREDAARFLCEARRNAEC